MFKALIVAQPLTLLCKCWLTALSWMLSSLLPHNYREIEGFSLCFTANRSLLNIKIEFLLKSIQPAMLARKMTGAWWSASIVGWQRKKTKETTKLQMITRSSLWHRLKPGLRKSTRKTSSHALGELTSKAELWVPLPPQKIASCKQSNTNTNTLTDNTGEKLHLSPICTPFVTHKLHF